MKIRLNRQLVIGVDFVEEVGPLIITAPIDSVLFKEKLLYLPKKDCEIIMNEKEMIGSHG